MTTEYLLAGFGGQGVLFGGKFVANLGLLEGKEVSWLPSYGPAMRGGTANCSVIVSTEAVGSPIVSAPDVVIAMNLPSLEKFESAVKPGGTIYIDSTLTSRQVARTDINAVYIPATRLASDAGVHKLALVVVLGALLKGTCRDLLAKVLEATVDVKRREMLDANMLALQIGSDFVG